ncbi:MAG: hypothetical protein ACLPHI_19375 [Terriglobales bacterium]|jgi:hypothetical protein
MSISGILSNTYNQYQIGATPNPIQQQIQQLGTALQSGNLSAAQSDFASLQAAFSQPSTTTGAPTSTAGGPVNQAFNQLASDLQSGNLSAAQKDFATVQQDIHGPNGGPSFSRFPHSHHHGGGGDSSTAENTLLQNLNLGGQNVSPSSLPGAQQAYVSLQQQLQQFALGGAALTSESPVSFDA